MATKGAMARYNELRRSRTIDVIRFLSRFLLQNMIFAAEVNARAQNVRVASISVPLSLTLSLTQKCPNNFYV